MDAALLNLLAVLRPIFFIDSGSQLFGLKIFDVAAIGLSALLMFALSITMTLRKSVRFSPIDLFLLAFAFWCVAAYVIYPDKSILKELAKLILPPLTYVAAKNILVDRTAYQKMLTFLIIGFSVPVLLSGALIVMGQGVEYISYWTKIPRYRGVYSGAHNMAHNMALFLMLLIVYRTLLKQSVDRPQVSQAWIVFCAMLGSVALYCLYSGRVRTTIIGLLVFGAVYYYYVNRRILFAGAVLLTIVVPVLMPSVVIDLFYDVAKVVSGEWEVGKLGSNRINIWGQNIALYAELPLDRQIAGVGIGNKLDIVGSVDEEFDVDNFRNSHNDYLEVLIQTGLVGFLLFVPVQVLLYQRVRRLVGHDRQVFLALFWAVFVMNFVSNSYVTRFGLAQMFYMVIAYVEIPERRRARDGTTGKE